MKPKSTKAIKQLFLHILTFCCCSIVTAQQITVDNNVPLSDLILDNLAENCVEISNISSFVNGNPHGLNSYGSFTRGNSNFPFTNGIVLATGSAASAGNGIISNPLNESASSWGTDPDIETALGTTNTTNATSIEFDFRSASGEFKFNYLIASEEYQDFNSFCNSQEGVVFLIREAATPTAPYTNIALVPNTTDPVVVGNISPGINTAGCPARNQNFFAGFNFGDTNYEGRSTILTATTAILPGVTYHVKLIIADLNTGAADSAVFIEGSSFDILNLGEDNPQQQCIDALTLNADINNVNATYQWFVNNTPVPAPEGIAPTFVVEAVTQAPVTAPTYRVDVEVPGVCSVSDEIVLNLVNGEEISALTNLELCDETGPEVFTLNTKTTEVLDLSQEIPFQLFAVSYHTSIANARANTNPVTTASPPTSEIFIRIQDQDSNCFVISRFQLVVNAPPTNATVNYPVCDCDNDPEDGFTTIDLSTQNNALSANTPNVTVASFHNTQSDAANDLNPISTPVNYINTSANSAQLFARITNTVTGCTNVSTLNISITNGPVINQTPIPLDACLEDPSNAATFDLTTAATEILGSFTTSIPLTYYTTQEGAKSGLTDEITNSTAFTITTAEETVYVRVVDDVTGCVAVAPLEVHKELLLTGTDDGPFGVCDTFSFNLNDVRNRLFERFRDDSDMVPPNYQARFFDENGNLITTSRFETSTALTNITAELTNTSGASCTKIKTITLRRDPPFTFLDNRSETICDVTAPLNDNSSLIDLNTFDAIATKNDAISTEDQANFSVLYFDDKTNAETPSLNAQPLGRFFQNTSNPTIIYARIESEDSECFHVTEFTIDVISPPNLGAPTPLALPCLPIGITEGTITLQDVETHLGNPTLTYSYFDNRTDAENLDNTTNGIFDFTRPYPVGVHTIYIRAENTTAVNSCLDIAPLRVIINSEPQLPDPDNRNLTSCIMGNSSSSSFTLSDFDARILNNQAGSSEKEVLYFEDSALSIPIDKTAPRNFNDGTPVYVRIQNSLNPNSCPVSASFILQVGTIPVVNLPLSFTNCIPSGEPLVFDLQAEANTIKQNTPDGNLLDFLFFEGQGTNRILITNPENYILQGSSTIEIEIENRNTGCATNSTVINLIALEQPNVENSRFPPVCDTDTDPYDGVATFDLSSPANQIPNFIQTVANTSANIEVSYFNDSKDVSDPSKAINPADLANFRSNSRSLHVNVENTLSNCSTVIELKLEVVAPPVITPITAPILECFTNSGSYDLTQVDSMLIVDPSTVTISYHSTPTGAATNTDIFVANTFTYTTPGDTEIWANVVDAVPGGCSIISPFLLSIQPNPIAQIPQDLVECDDDFDNRLIFDLTKKDAEILGPSQNPNAFSVRYFESLDDAEANRNALNTDYDAESNTTVFARVENTSTGCFATTAFNLILNPLPIIPIEDVVTLCLNDLPLVIDANTGNPNDSYLWQTTVNPNVNGSTNPRITLTDPSQIGNYSITVTTDNSALNTDDCNSSKTFTVIESQQAIIDISTTTDFVDPNSITVTVNGIGDYVYSLDGDTPQESGFFGNVTLGKHIVTVIDLNGCEPIDTEVFVIDIPKFFTPNNDGFFDNWHIVGARQLPGSEIQIFDRYGKLLKMLTHNSPGWNGTYNGQRMPADDYWFSANIIQEGEMFNIKGHFTLKR